MILPASRSSGARYTVELGVQEGKLRELRRRAREGTLTLVYAARDTEHNGAVVLADILPTGASGQGLAERGFDDAVEEARRARA
ncbi:MAG: DUF488 family protein, N3 subclade [Gaiellaceae bacterium]